LPNSFKVAQPGYFFNQNSAKSLGPQFLVNAEEVNLRCIHSIRLNSKYNGNCIDECAKSPSKPNSNVSLLLLAKGIVALLSMTIARFSTAINLPL